MYFFLRGSFGFSDFRFLWIFGVRFFRFSGFRVLLVFVFFHSVSQVCGFKLIYYLQAALIRPFVYQSVLIPILPESLFTMISAPVPFLVGVDSLPPKSEIPNDVVIVDVERDRVLNLGKKGEEDRVKILEFRFTRRARVTVRPALVREQSRERRGLTSWKRGGGGGESSITCISRGDDAARAILTT